MQDQKNEGKPEQQPTVTFYNGDNAVGNAMGSRADREGGNSGRSEDRTRGNDRQVRART